MARISKTDVTDVLLTAAKKLEDAAGPDGRVSRADVKKKLAELKGVERKLVDVFYKFIDNRDQQRRDGKDANRQVTSRDINSAVAYAKEHLIANYDLNNNGLSKDEIKTMRSGTARFAVELAEAIKTAAQAPDLGVDGFNDFLDTFSEVSKKRFTSADGITGTLAKQIMAAVNQASYDPNNLREAFASVDQSEIIVREMKDPATKKVYTSIDFGAGDNTYGAIFKKGQSAPIISIHDGDFETPKGI